MERKVLRDSILHHFALSSVSKKKKQLRGAGLSIVPCWHIWDSGFSIGPHRCFEERSHAHFSGELWIMKCNLSGSSEQG